jgi:2-amino-4-hydroxy-6-hydroxymethyldihydropteridine diphosphokinase
MRAGIALGANLGDRRASLTTARGEICALPGVEPPFLASSLYETEPVDCEPGATSFFNAVIEIGFEGPSRDLLLALQRIELALGRPADHAANRSRTIDLDLLYHGSHVADEGELVLPHPRLHFRAFVLQPLAEIRPNLILPGKTRTVQEMAAALGPTPSVVQLSLQW